MIEDLWGEIPAGEKLETPDSILRDQANLLAEKTGGELIGKVVSLRGDDIFRFRFRIEVPQLNGYTVDFFTVEYPIGFYPVAIRAHIAGVETGSCNDIESYKRAVRSIFRSETVTTIIKRLRTQIASTDEEPPPF